MTALEQLIEPYLVHAYEAREKTGKRIEVALYSLDASDNKFRLIKFVNEAMKEFYTTEDRAEAEDRFRKMLG